MAGFEGCVPGCRGKTVQWTVFSTPGWRRGRPRPRRANPATSTMGKPLIFQGFFHFWELDCLCKKGSFLFETGRLAQIWHKKPFSKARKALIYKGLRLFARICSWHKTGENMPSMMPLAASISSCWVWTYRS